MILSICAKHLKFPLLLSGTNHICLRITTIREGYYS